MKGCVQWNSVYCREDFALSRDQTRSPRSVGQRLTELPGLLLKRPSSWIELQIRGVTEDKKASIVTPHLNCLSETVLMRGNKIHFMEKYGNLSLN